MAKTDEAEDAQQGTEDEQGSDREETVGPPPFAKGWRWPLIFLVVGIVALAAFLTLLTSPTAPPVPPPPPPPLPPALVVPLG